MESLKYVANGTRVIKNFYLERVIDLGIDPDEFLLWWENKNWLPEEDALTANSDEKDFLKVFEAVMIEYQLDVL